MVRLAAVRTWAEAECQLSVSVPVDIAGVRGVFKLVDALEESDDVQNVHTNVDVSDEVLGRSTKSTAAGLKVQTGNTPLAALTNPVSMASLWASLRLSTTNHQAPGPVSRSASRPCRPGTTALHVTREKPVMRTAD
jgi:hypothetical protein